MRGLIADTLVLASARGEIADWLEALLRVYSLFVLAYIISSLVLSFGKVPYNRTLMAVLDFLRDVAEPLLRPFRKLLPTFGPFDFSPILAILALNLVGGIIVAVVRG